MPVIHKLTIGQMLYTPGRRYSPASKGHRLEVVKVGRKYASVAEAGSVVGQIDLTESLFRVELKGYECELYLSKDDYKKVKALREAWSEFYNEIRMTYGRMPEGITFADIAQARALLNMRKQK